MREPSGNIRTGWMGTKCRHRPVEPPRPILVTVITINRAAGCNSTEREKHATTGDCPLKARTSLYSAQCRCSGFEGCTGAVQGAELCPHVPYRYNPRLRREKQVEFGINTKETTRLCRMTRCRPLCTVCCMVRHLQKGGMAQPRQNVPLESQNHL